MSDEERMGELEQSVDTSSSRTFVASIENPHDSGFVVNKVRYFDSCPGVVR